MKVYLVEKLIGNKMEPIAIKTNWELAWYLVNGNNVGIITEMEVDKEYLEGIGICQHWHCGRPRRKPRKRVVGI